MDSSQVVHFGYSYHKQSLHLPYVEKKELERVDGGNHYGCASWRGSKFNDKKGSVYGMDQITIKTRNPIMSSLLVFHRVYRLVMQSVMLVFSAPLVN